MFESLINLKSFKYVKKVGEGYYVNNIPVSFVLSLLSDGETPESIVATFPELTIEMVKEVLDFASEVIMSLEAYMKNAKDTPLTVVVVNSIPDNGGLLN